MCEGQGGCMEWLEPRRAQAVHDMMTRLLGRCSCERGDADVIEIWGVNGARSAELAKTG